MTPAALANSLLRRPYQRAAVGPEAYDCWSLVVHVERELFGRELPLITSYPDDVRALMAYVSHHEANRFWTRCETGAHGGIVQMSRVTLPWHIGVFLDVDGGGILHCSPKVGVCFDTPLSLRMARWRCDYYDWRG